MNFETVIGLEVHLQLATDSKLFCGCSAKFGALPNTQTCPVCLGLPGVLPVLNQRAFGWGIRAALAFNCKIAKVMKFDRKQYYYPDLPKNYQISQYDQPLCHNGHLDISVNGISHRIGIRRIHMEEDAGKLLHDAREPFSYVDYNRAGVPLLEIVSEPDMRLPEEAYQYLLELKAILEYLGISSCDMEKGSLRCDVNLSLRKKGDIELGSKVEIKNLNSFKAVKAALEYEQARQAEELMARRRIPQETRLWDAKAMRTESMRSKEEASDYRYFPEPDLVPFVIDDSLVKKVKLELPELPAQKRKRLVEKSGLSSYDAQVLTQHRSLAELFDKTVALSPNPKPVANWIMGDLLAYCNSKSIEPESVNVRPEWILHILEAIDSGVISGKMAKELFVLSIEGQKDPSELIQEKGLRQIVDDKELSLLAESVISEYPQSVSDYLKGKQNALMFLVGKCMQKSQGKANPGQITEMLRQKLKG